MNTEVLCRLYSQATNGVDILLDVAQLFYSFEKRLSRFDPTSELSRLNAHSRETFPASPTLLSVLEVALWAAEATSGLYDPTILPDLEQAGYDRTFEHVANPTPLTPDSVGSAATESVPRPGWSTGSYQAISLNRSRREIYRPVGMRLDLGGMGKGWTVDRAADQLQSLGPFLVNAGGDIFAYHSPPGMKGWSIDLIHPLKSNHFMAKVTLHHKALATSTIAKRRWRRNGHLHHHLIDPRTRQPAQTDALSVSVIAERTVLAEIYAKVALILGSDAGLAYLEKLPGVEGLVFTADSRIRHTNGCGKFLELLDPAGYPAT